MLRNKTCKHHPNNLSRFLTRFFLSFGFYWVRWLHCGCILNVLEELYIQKTSSKKVRIFQISNNSSTNSSKIRLWFEDWHVHKDKYLASPFHFHAQLHFFVLRQFAAERAAAFQSTCPDGSQPLIWTEQPRFLSGAMVKRPKCCTKMNGWNLKITDTLFNLPINSPTRSLQNGTCMWTRWWYHIESPSKKQAVISSESFRNQPHPSLSSN